MNDIPNLIIFRSGDDFVECPLDEMFRLYGDGKIFHPRDSSDSYYDLTDSQIVLSSRVNDGSLDLMWFTVMSPEGIEKTITELHPEDLIEIVQNAALEYCTRQ